jgi:multidrug efflux pump
MITLIKAAFSRGRTTIATLILILIAGVGAYNTIPKESDPDITIPIVYVSMHHEGISPEDAEKLLVKPMERELRSIEGIKELKANAFNNGANVVMEFIAGYDIDKALDDVRKQVDQAKPDLPNETDEPSVSEISFSQFPVLIVTLSGDVPERALLRLARDLRDEIESIPAILKAKIAGDREELTEIVLDPVMLESYGLEASSVIQFFARNNQLIAAGSLDTGNGRFPIKVPGLFQRAEEIMEMPVKINNKIDAIVKLKDIATVRRTFKDSTGFARLNGKPAIGLEVSKRAGENIIETIGAIKAVVKKETAEWPEHIHVTFSQDRSNDVKDMLSDLQNNITSAILLVMIVIIGALGIRSSILVGVAIPGAFLMGILTLSMLGLTINIVVLFSLILAVGMLVDGAIVVTEYADRKMLEGHHPKDAYQMAATRMAWPIIASTATTLAAFLPLLFWPGIVGEFMKFLPITLLATLIASLLMALVFVPTLGGIIGTRPPKSKQMEALSSEDDIDLNQVTGFTRTYISLLKKALKNPLKIVLGSVGVLFIVIVLMGLFNNGVEFFPSIEPENAMVHIHARGNLSVKEQDALVKEAEDRILKLDYFKSVYTSSGKGNDMSGGFGAQEKQEDVIGSIHLEFLPWDQRKTAKEIFDEIRLITSDLAGIYIEPEEEEQGPPTGKPIHFQLRSRHAEQLSPLVDKILDHLQQDPDYINIEDSRPIPGIEWQLTVDRAVAARFGADVAGIGDAIKLITNGIKLSDYTPDSSDDKVDIVVRYPVSHRNISELDRLRIITNEGLVPISYFVKRTPKHQTGKIERVDTERTLRVKADVKEGVLPHTKIKELQKWIKQENLDNKIEITFKGEDEEQKKSGEFLTKAFGVALFIMAIILVTQFNSFYSMFLILSAVILSTIGVMIGLLVTGSPFGIVMNGIGVIALAGIVVNNNIILIDTYDRLKKIAKSPLEALLLTGAQRLRPVMLTAFTTVLGLVPMMLALNVNFFTRAVSYGAPSTQFWTQLSTSIVFGLAFATILTLVVTPCALMLKETLIVKLKSLFVNKSVKTSSIKEIKKQLFKKAC